jgi:plasmid stabilization system protein ParE
LTRTGPPGRRPRRLDGATLVPETQTEADMPQRAWSPKRERQYEHIRDGLLERGANEDKAEEIAARTVNKERARAGEARESSRTSIEDISSGRRGGLRSHRGSGGRTYDQLYEEARDKGIRGRSSVTKQQLLRAVEAKDRHPRRD